MSQVHSVEDLLDFLSHAGDRGIIPVATAQALGVAVRNVASILSEEERRSLPLDDLDPIIRRFNNKRARDFNPGSLKEYGRRLKRAAEMYIRWREDPANFTAKTRATQQSKKKERPSTSKAIETEAAQPVAQDAFVRATVSLTGYSTAFPVRQGQVVTVDNIPHDLTTAEAERLAAFIKLLASS